jgi:hypothetical protein
MRPDNGTSTNGINGSPTSPSRKTAVSGSLNGTSPRAASNGQSNGSVRSSPTALLDPIYRGHDRGEVTRIIIQALYGLGYNEAASALSRESNYELETSAVAAFKSAVLEGRWSEAERILVGSFPPDDGGGSIGGDSDAENGRDSHPQGLTLAEGADKNEMLFCLRQQKFLELLEKRDLARALLVLRQELTPLNHDTHQLHALSRFASSFPSSAFLL